MKLPWRRKTYVGWVIPAQVRVRVWGNNAAGWTWEAERLDLDARWLPVGRGIELNYDSQGYPAVASSEQDATEWAQLWVDPYILDCERESVGKLHTTDRIAFHRNARDPGVLHAMGTGDL